MKKLVLAFKKLNKRKLIHFIREQQYLYYYKKKNIHPKTILLESRHGKDIEGNIFYLLKELNNNPEYKDYKLFVSAKKNSIKRIQFKLDFYKLDKIKTLRYGTIEYFKILATAKYLVNNTTFSHIFMKKEEQIYLNTWHGTPLKTMGIKEKSTFHRIGNTQRNFILSDMLLFTNKFAQDRIMEDYMVAHHFDGEILFDGYPRNEIFFDNKERESLRNNLNLTNKEIIVYMPTWRGNFKNHSFNEHISEYLKTIDEQLKDNQIMFVNLHPFMKNIIDYSEFKNIKIFPKEYETYHFLAASDILITDYSSVFFDYANTRNKIILFNFDEKDYLINRGLYFELSKLPFPKCKNVDELIFEINQPKNYDDSKFVNYFNKYDNLNASKTIINKLFQYKKSNKKLLNDSKNILIYGGNFAKNGITTALINLLNNLDTKKDNYYVLINQKNSGNNLNTIKALNTNIKFYTFRLKLNMNLIERLIHKIYFNFNFSNRFITKVIARLYKRENEKLFSNFKFDKTIHFSGYEAQTIHLLSHSRNNTIFVHNDMVSEIKLKKNQHYPTLNYAYKNYDTVAPVSNDITKSIFEIANINNIHIVNNAQNLTEVIDKSKLKLTFDETTESNIDVSALDSILDSNALKFINIGRFSPEKGHTRLIDTFDKFWKENHNSYLIIIGGYGQYYNDILKHLETVSAKNHVIIIKSINNPFPILARSDLFILSSYYEALPLVLFEADALKIPIISTSVTGPRGFLTEYNGYLVENSEDGLYQGILDFVNGKVTTLNIDFDKYNEKVLKQFNYLLD